MQECLVTMLLPMDRRSSFWQTASLRIVKLWKSNFGQQVLGFVAIISWKGLDCLSSCSLTDALTRAGWICARPLQLQTRLFLKNLIKPRLKQKKLCDAKIWRLRANQTTQNSHFWFVVGFELVASSQSPMDFKQNFHPEVEEGIKTQVKFLH